MNTSAGRLGAVGLAVILSCALSSCGDEDAGDETGGTGSEPSPVESSPAASAPDASGPSGNAGEDPSPESSPTPVPASSEGPAQNWPEPEVPDEIYEETQEGALAALEYWFEAITYLQLTGDYGPVDAVSASDCETCNNKISQFYDLYEVEQGWYVAEGAAAEDKLVSEITEDARVGILFELIEGGYTVYDSDSAELGSVEGGRFDAEATLSYDEEKWLVLQIDIPESGTE